ncbi:MAG: FAD binding domain-containing protein [Myxococcota bacterium]
MHTSNAPVWTANTVDEALRLRSEHPDATVIAGGTDLMVFIEGGDVQLVEVLNIWGCEGMSGIEKHEDGFRIGALTTWAEIGRHVELPSALRECADTVGAAQIQNRGTVGGNIVNASPAGDSLPLWLALDAEMEVASVRGSRRIPASEFWIGYRKTALAQDELLLAVHIQPNPNDRLYYRKVGTRMAQAISKVMLGGRLRIEDGIVTEARVALGSIAATPVRLTSVESALTGKPIDGAAANLVADEITPIDDIRSTAEYRKIVATRIVRSWLENEAGQQ